MGCVFKKRSLRTSDPTALKFLKIPFAHSLSPLSSFFLFKSLCHTPIYGASIYGLSHSDQTSGTFCSPISFVLFVLFCVYFDGIKISEFQKPSISSDLKPSASPFNSRLSVFALSRRLGYWRSSLRLPHQVRSLFLLLF